MGISLILYLVNMPIAAEITLAFHARIKIAPAPKIREKRRVNIITPKLFPRIDKNLAPFVVAFEEIIWLVKEYSATQFSTLPGLFMLQYVSICAFNKSGFCRIIYQNEKATINPRKSHMKA